ncbi:hypothetical protein AGMMS4956_06280 [Bacteroidia bacterium]|nr:hypothetical protein AGMMS4956_06280 [Bacteroidia bacterium]
MRKNKILLAFVLLCCACGTYAQQAAASDNKNQITLSVWVPASTGLTDEAQKNLHNKVVQIAAKQGVAADPGHSRFVFAVNVVELEKNITPTAPPKHSYKLDVTFYIGDGIEGKIFSSVSTTVSGVGDNATKAYMNALKNINVLNPNYKKFADQGKAKIVEYYNSQCDPIIRKAQTLSAAQKYDEAIYKLMSVPEACAECRSKAISAVDSVYQQKIDYDCKTTLAEANNLWNTEQNAEGAKKATAALLRINSKASCFGEALVLSQKIAEQIQQLDAQALETQKEELAFQREEQKQRLDAYRDIQKAYAENQPEVEYKPLW